MAFYFVSTFANAQTPTKQRPYGYRGLKIITSLRLRFPDFQRKNDIFLKVSAFEAEHVIHLLLKLRIMIADNVGKGDLCDRTLESLQFLPIWRYAPRELEKRFCLSIWTRNKNPPRIGGKDGKSRTI
ncbi:hypothetical protein [Bathymodiolus japonicus methanotrophic gill symbiont]|uniref:hypothetical protein n=1 Tax=Bathymodiolus japonicus methanotrophic gill symbiont TaxID=113269 RepID=UPI001E448E6D|nr:hypothetical protein [Bathymodiolus japonicus methanotrophic gill symbiont]